MPFDEPAHALQIVVQEPIKRGGRVVGREPKAAGLDLREADDRQARGLHLLHLRRGGVTVRHRKDAAGGEQL